MSVISPDNTITIALSSKDRHASADWYKNMLGFELRYHADAVGWSEIQTNTPGVTIGLGERQEPNTGNATPVFGVADVAAARKSLEAAGVKFEGDTITIDNMVSLASLTDLDGNALMLAQVLTKAG